MKALQWVKAILVQESDKPPAFLGIRSSEWFISTAVSLAVFTDIFLYGIIVPVVPYALTKRVDVAPEDVQHWISILIAIYGAALLGFSPPCGWIADQTASRRSPLLLGLLALAGATVMLNVGSTIAIFVAGRILQGLSAAVVWIAGLALLVDTVGQKEAGRYMGYVGVSMSLGILLAPLLSGVVYQNGGYNAVFVMAYALIGIDIFLRLALVEKRVAIRWTENTPPEARVEEVPQNGAGDVRASLSNDRRAPTSEPKQDSLVRVAPDASLSAGPAHPAREEPPSRPTRQRRRRDYLPPLLSLLTSWRLVSALWASLIQATLMTSFDGVIPLYVKETFSWRSTGAGLIFLPIVLPSLISPAAGWFSDTYGPRLPATLGFVLAAPMFILLRLITRNSLDQKVLLCALLALIGLAVTIMIPATMAEITHVVSSKEKARPGLYGPKGAYAQAYALFNMAFAGGCIIGPLLAGMVRESSGWGTMAWTLGLLSALSAIPTFIFAGGLVGKKADLMGKPKPQKLTGGGLNVV